LGKEDASKQGRRILDIDADEDITLVNVQNDADMFGVNDLDALKSAKVQEKLNVVEKPSESITTTPTLTTTTIATIPTPRKGIVIQEADTTTTPTTIISIPKPPQDKGKGIMIEEPIVD
ncbi:hypothetical protein Tco_1494996, partial [Tanacetum coccineum]